MPVIEGKISLVPKNLIDSQLELHGRRNFTRILRTKATTYNAVSVGALIKVYMKSGGKKRGTKLKPRAILSIE